MSQRKTPGLFGILTNLYVVTLVIYLILRGLFGDRFWWLSLVNTFAYILFLPLLALLPLALLFRARLYALRLLPVALVGGLWYGPYYLPKSPVQTSENTIRVATGNMWIRNPRLDELESWIRNSGADVLLMQEITPEYAAKRLDSLKDMYPFQYLQEDALRWAGNESMNVTLSRYPIISSDFIDLKTPDTANPLRIVVEVDGKRIAIYNVHLAFPRGQVRLPSLATNFYLTVVFGFDDNIRNKQIDGLLQQLEKEPYPYIVGGDFNTSDQSATYGKLAQHLHDSFRERGVGMGGSWPVSAARGLPAFIPPIIRIDYLWHSDGLRAVEAHQGAPTGSDHLPLFATLEIAE
jgi:endonuclease/exonuclease/phosphatase family metal-dependent hydrolase